MDFERTIVFNDNGWEYGGFGKEMGCDNCRVNKTSFQNQSDLLEPLSIRT
jgi:hypothetical protein